MPALANVIEPGLSPSALLEIERKLRARYLRLESPHAQRRAKSSSRLLETSALFLEILLVGAFVREAMEHLGCSTLEGVTPEVAEEVRQRIHEMYNLDPTTIVQEATAYLKLPPPRKGEFMPSLEAIVRSMKAVLEACPIHHLEELAASQGLEAWGHRCRVAYDGLRAFVLRNDPNQREQLSVLGLAYVRGALSIPDIATLLEMHPVDVVALLEDHGYSRNIDQLRLDEPERANRFSRMREDRVRRGGAPSWTKETIARDVVASERIEGVDARHWIFRDG